MLKKIFLFNLLFISVLNAQAYLGYTTKRVNLRDAPSTDAVKISTLKGGTPLFIIDLTEIDGFYNVIVIETNTEGYVHKSFVKIEKEIQENSEGIFEPREKSEEYEPQLNVFNNTSKTLTLKLNSITYSFSPREKRTINVYPGIYEYRASAPGVIPDYGSETIESNVIYDWEFYIIRR